MTTVARFAIVSTAIGFGVVGSALAQSANGAWYEASVNPDLRNTGSSVMVSFTQPFSGGLDMPRLQSEARFEIGVNLVDPYGSALAYAPRNLYSFGITGSGITYIGLGEERLSFAELNMRFNAEGTGEITKGNNTGLLIVGGVVLTVGVLVVAAADLNDTIHDCTVDLVNGPAGGCPG